MKNSSANVTSERDPQKYDLGLQDNPDEFMEEIPLDYLEPFEHTMILCTEYMRIAL